MGHLNGNGTCWTAAVDWLKLLLTRLGNQQHTWSKRQGEMKLRANIVLFSLKILWLNKAYSFKWVRVWTEHISNGSGVPSVGHSCCHCHFIMQWKRLAFGSVTEDDGHALRRKWFKAHCLSLNRVIGQSGRGRAGVVVATQFNRFSPIPTVKQLKRVTQKTKEHSLVGFSTDFDGIFTLIKFQT